ncbi:N-acetylmuramoyl-L-alanine amidase, partial [Enterococcus faecalis]|nr:N-acetylmuramoyl-L-alanine amidase [Enterococcus faecalis]
MKKSIKMLLTLVLLISFVPIGANAYQVEQDPIDFGGYFPGYATNELIVLHESGNGNNVGPNSLDNETAYMKRNWTSAYV